MCLKVDALVTSSWWPPPGALKHLGKRLLWRLCMRGVVQACRLQTAALAGTARGVKVGFVMSPKSCTAATLLPAWEPLARSPRQLWAGRKPQLELTHPNDVSCTRGTAGPRRAALLGRAPPPRTRAGTRLLPSGRPGHIQPWAGSFQGHGPSLGSCLAPNPGPVTSQHRC